MGCCLAKPTRLGFQKTLKDQSFKFLAAVNSMMYWVTNPYYKAFLSPG